MAVVVAVTGPICPVAAASPAVGAAEEAEDFFFFLGFVVCQLLC